MANKSNSRALGTRVEKLRAARGDNLASIVLYGSVAAGDHVEQHSDHNLLIALKRIASEDLQLSQNAMRDWLKSGQPTPVYFTVEELSRAADVFPIEFLQMEKARRVLYGRDPFEFVDISQANLRHHTQNELSTKLMH